MSSIGVAFGGEFGCALDGEFRPDSDQEQRLHRLAFLAIATVKKGVLLDDAWPIVRERLHVSKQAMYPRAYTYTPSWSNTSCVALAEGYGELRITGLKLTKEDTGNTLSLFDMSDGDTSRLIYARDGGEQTELNIEVGPNLSNARQEIARVAESFFNQA